MRSRAISRRAFHASASVLALSAASAGRVLGANEKLRMGFIGVGNRGSQLLDAFDKLDDVRVSRGLRYLQALSRSGRQAIFGKGCDIYRLSQVDRFEGNRCRRDRHAGSLARDSNHSCLPSGQGCLL